MRLSFLLLALSALIGPTMSQTIVEVAQADGNFAGLAGLINLAPEIAEELSGPGPFTVFAPPSAALLTLPPELVTRLTNPDWIEHLEDVLLYHVLDGQFLSGDLSDGIEVETLNGYNVSITPDPISINGVPVATPDVLAENGVIHGIESVLSPPSLMFSIFEFGELDNDFSILVSLIEAAGLAATLTEPNGLTLFAPTNEAFGKLDAETLTFLQDPANVDELEKILTYHVVKDIVYASAIAEQPTLTSLQGTDLITSIVGEEAFINDATIIDVDSYANNGVVHVIDTVLIPPTIADIASAVEGFSTLADLLGQAGLEDDLSSPGPFTVFAPPDDAFSALPTEEVTRLTKASWYKHLEDVLLYHVLGSQVVSADLTEGAQPATLNGETLAISLDPVTVNGVSVVQPDIFAGNGVIHVVSSVLQPTSLTSTIVDIAQGNAAFSTLVELVIAAELDQVLSGSNFTVFAPTNDAFAKLRDGTIDTLKDPANKATLQSILTYHVTVGVVYSEKLTDTDVVTVEGTPVTISTSGPMVNNANIVIPDILANNGVIHVIDTVLLIPEAASESPSQAPVVGSSPSEAPAVVSDPTAAPTPETTTAMPSGSEHAFPFIFMLSTIMASMIVLIN